VLLGIRSKLLVFSAPPCRYDLESTVTAEVFADSCHV
jgi:hypothetical protein